MMKNKIHETDLSKKCIKYAKQLGLYIINIHGGGWSAKGAPDLITCIDGKFVAFELKVGKNDMQEDQKIHRARIIKNGGLHYAPYTFDEFKSIIKEFTDYGVSNTGRENPDS